jgi:beta-galactosidase
MTRSSFNEDWTFRKKVSIFAKLNQSPDTLPKITLPHDALFAEARSAGNAGKNAYFPCEAAFEYVKQFAVPEEYRSKRVSLEFQGAYRDAMIYVNGEFAGHRPYGYATFVVELDDFLKYGESNEIRVDIRSHDDSRWYTGCGITRDVVLIVTELVHLAANAVKVTTPDIDDERAVVALEIGTKNNERTATTVTVDTEIRDAQGAQVSKHSSPLTVRAGRTEIARQRLYVRAPCLWSPRDVDFHRELPRDFHRELTRVEGMSRVARDGQAAGDLSFLVLGLAVLSLKRKLSLPVSMMWQ